MNPTCPTCGHIHSGNDARAVGRFTGTHGFVAANAGTPTRATRAEAEADECQWRQQHQQTPPGRLTESHPPSKRTVRSTATLSRPSCEFESRPGDKSTPAPFPAARMETLARTKAWADFLAHVRFSLGVWQIDDELHAECEDVFAWLRSCRNDLDALIPASERTAA